MTMRVTMLNSRRGEGVDLVAGQTYTVSDALGAELVGMRHATDTDKALTPPGSEPVRGGFNPLTGGVETSVGGVYVNWSNTALAFPYNSDGIDAAIASIVASGAPGVVVYAATDYAVTRNHTLADNVSHIGAPPKLVMNGDVPDASFSTSGGTRFICASGVKCFMYGNTGNVTLPSPLAPTALKGVTMRCLTFVGGARHIDTGAYLSMGAIWGRFEELYSFDSTEIGFNFENFQHCTFHNIYQSSQVAGGGVRFAASLNNVLLPGNSTWTGEVYTYTPLRTARSIVFESSGPAGCQFNQLHVSGRLQANRYGGAPLAISVTTTNASPSMGIADAGHYAAAQVGAPVVFSGTAPGGFTSGVVYFVSGRPSASTITLSPSPASTFAQSATSTGTFTLQCNGYAGIEIIANTDSTFTNCDFGNLDIEASQCIAGLVLRRVRQCRAFLSELMGSNTNTAIVGRDAVIKIECASMSNKTTDVDNTQVSLVHAQSGVRTVTAGETLVGNRHECQMNYSGSGAITINIPTGLPFGFECSFAQMAVGAVSINPNAGVTLVSRGNLRTTNGTGSVIRLKQTGTNTYIMSGDLA